MKKIILAALLSTTALSATAYENSNGKDFYAQVNAGYAQGVKPGKSYNGKMGNSAIIGLEAGYNVNNNFRTSLSIDYNPNFKAERNAKNGIYYGKNIDVAYTADPISTKVKSFVTMINLYGDITNYNGFTPYVMAGVGIARNKTKTTFYSATVLGSSNNGSIEGATKTNAAFKIGFGTKYSVNNDVDLDIHYQYVDAGKFNTGTKEVLGKSFKGEGKIRSNQVLVGAAYKF